MTIQRFSFLLTIFTFSALNVAMAQAQPKPKLTVINLTNPSLEDTPRKGEKGGKAPVGWIDCGGVTETSPDIQPGHFGVMKAPSNGSSYIGLVVRDNETYESVGQRLPQPIVAGKCYEWSLDLCRAEEYTSPTTNSGSKEMSFSSAVQVRIWGGNGACGREELLYTTPYVVNTRWLGYLIPLKPKKNYSYIVVEAYFKTPMLFPYNGNVLIDNASPIREMDCSQKKEEVAKVEVKRTTQPGKAPAPPTAKKTPPPPSSPKVEPAVVVTRNITEVDPAKLKKGDVLQIQNLYFDANQFAVKAECESTLSEVYNFLSKNPKVIVEIAGHTNNRPSDTYANTLSANRAKAVYEWLIQRGIPEKRVQFKGYGKTMPIAPNTTEEGRKKNQRVEVRVLSVTG